ncbi:MAG: Na/Pi cotransporter family protein, partial [Erysipelotrichaceae bacterium]|nr:Na/Pi cotransporter family protein [Erysipelotrichaceae bacterium]
TNTLKTEPEQEVAYLDERLFATPSVAVAECNKLSVEMANMARESVEKALANLNQYTEENEKSVVDLEEKTDIYEDRLGTYLVRLSGHSLGVDDNKSISRVLHTTDDFERISDHALNLVNAGKELHDKQLHLSDKANEEMKVLQDAVSEVVKTAIESYENVDSALAEKVEPLEQVIDLLTETIRLNHTERLKVGECTIERGSILIYILDNCERISDHCSNIAVAVLTSKKNMYDPHKYLNKIKTMENPRFKKYFTSYQKKYRLP